MVEEERGPWETESGLIDDVDAWIKNPRFGVKEEYSQAVIETSGGESKGAMCIFDLADEAGVVIGSQGWSIGTGWEVSEDGLHITHAKRKNVVGSSLYGQLQNRVVKELGVDMSQYGLPTDAMSWDRLGFHWMQTVHETVAERVATGKREATGLMPTSFLGKLGEQAAEAEAPTPVAKPAAKPVVRPTGKVASAGEQAALKLVAECGTVKEFILKSVKVPEITADDPLMAKCLDDSATGFYRLNKK